MSQTTEIGDTGNQAIAVDDDSGPIVNVNHGKGTFVAVKGLHAEVFEKANIENVDPLRCISLEKLRTRPFCRWGVRMIKSIITGTSDSDTFVKGFVSTGKFAVIVPIPAECSELVEMHFREEGRTTEEAVSLAQAGAWYHVVDGGHMHLALVEAIHEFSENFGGFRWPVVRIPWQNEDTLRAISLMCNEMQKEAHVIDFTLPDAMQNLREIIESHSKRTGVALVPGKKVKNGFIKEVMGIYAGRPGYADNTMRNVCGIVLKLSTPVISAIRTLLGEECEDYWGRLGSKKPFGNDTRVYKKLISSQSLKGVKTFLNHKAMRDEDRINVIHRLRFLARERESFKAFQASEIEEQCRRVIGARAEVVKFDNFLGGESWPREMENFRRNIFQTTLIDGDIKEHIGARKELLPAMVDAYVKATGAHGTQKLAMFRRRLSSGSVNESASQNGTSENTSGMQNGLADRVDDATEKEVLVAIAGQEGTMLEDAHVVAIDAAPDGANIEASDEPEEYPKSPLENCRVDVQRMTVTEFERNSVDLDSFFDFVIADPFQKVPPDDRRDAPDQPRLDELVDEKGITLYLQCLRRLLVPGGYCFIFLDWSRLQPWTSCCVSSQFEVVCEPFLVMKNAHRIQKMTMKGLQSVYDPALVIKRPGKHPTDFVVDKRSPYVHLPGCRMPRWCNVIDGVPPPAQRLMLKPSRAQVRPSERPCALYIELFQTFCPENGKVLDPCAGTLTTGLACIATNRQCVLLERDERCLSFAMPRLQEFAKARIMDEKANSVPLGESEVQEEETFLNDSNEIRIEDKINDDLAIVQAGRDGLGARSCGSEREIQNQSIAILAPTTPSQNRNVHSVAETGCSVSPIAARTRQVEDTSAEDDRLKGPGSNTHASFSDISSEESSPAAENSSDQIIRTSEQGAVASHAAALKRSRKSRLTMEALQVETASQTPSSFRRSKRTRRPVPRYVR